MKLKKIVLSNSALTQYKTCPRKFVLEKGFGLQPNAPQEPKTAADFGSMFHEAVDLATSSQPFEPAIASLPRSGRSMGYEHMKGLIEAYILYYTLPFDRDFKVISTEQNLTWSLGTIDNVEVYLTGTIDKVAECRRTGKLMIVDHKTSKSSTSYTIPYIDVSSQFSMYTYLMQTAGYDLNTTLVDCVSTAQSNLKKMATEPDNLFARHYTQRNVEQIASWLEDTKTTAASVIKDVNSATAFDVTTGPQPFACSAYFSKCPYLPLCGSAPGEQRNTILSNAYTQIEDSDNIHFNLEFE